jgi:hypothetical protein
MEVIKFKQLDCEDHQGQIVDISMSGVGIESNTPMEPGYVWFKNRIWGQHSGLLLWSKQVGSHYRSGIQFVSPTHDVELFANNQFEQPIQREPFKDLNQIVAMQIASLKTDPV